MVSVRRSRVAQSHRSPRRSEHQIPRRIRLAPGACQEVRDYLFGELEAASLSATLSGTYTFLPTLTLQVYGQAFMAFGRYSDFSRYPVQQGKLSPNILLSDLRPSAAPGPDLDPNFTSGTFNANVVIRWEYRMGSLVYVVYTHSQNDGLTPPPGQAGQLDFRQIVPRKAADVFLLKASYWWG